jgi:hypothetical protein
MFSLLFVVWRLGRGLCDWADHWCRGVLPDVCVCVYNRPQQRGILRLSWASEPQK